MTKPADLPAHILRHYRISAITDAEHAFEPDSRFIQWAEKPKQPPADVKLDSCAIEGADSTADYAVGLRQCAGERLFHRVLLVVAIVCLSIVAFVVPMGPL